MAGPSSSPVINRLMDPLKLLSRVSINRETAATKQAIAVFISDAPRPHSIPFLISAPNGSTVQASKSPTGTTSVWPAKQKFGDE